MKLTRFVDEPRDEKEKEGRKLIRRNLYGQKGHTK